MDVVVSDRPPSLTSLIQKEIAGEIVEPDPIVTRRSRNTRNQRLRRSKVYENNRHRRINNEKPRDYLAEQRARRVRRMKSNKKGVLKDININSSIKDNDPSLNDSGISDFLSTRGDTASSEGSKDEGIHSNTEKDEDFEDNPRNENEEIEDNNAGDGGGDENDENDDKENDKDESSASTDDEGHASVEDDEELSEEDDEVLSNDEVEPDNSSASAEVEDPQLKDENENQDLGDEFEVAEGDEDVAEDDISEKEEAAVTEEMVESEALPSDDNNENEDVDVGEEEDEEKEEVADEAMDSEEDKNIEEMDALSDNISENGASDVEIVNDDENSQTIDNEEKEDKIVENEEDVAESEDEATLADDERENQDYDEDSFENSENKENINDNGNLSADEAPEIPENITRQPHYRRISTQSLPSFKSVDVNKVAQNRKPISWRTNEEPYSFSYDNYKSRIKSPYSANRKPYSMSRTRRLENMITPSEFILQETEFDKSKSLSDITEITETQGTPSNSTTHLNGYDPQNMLSQSQFNLNLSRPKAPERRVSEPTRKSYILKSQTARKSSKKDVAEVWVPEEEKLYVYSYASEPRLLQVRRMGSKRVATTNHWDQDPNSSFRIKKR